MCARGERLEAQHRAAAALGRGDAASVQAAGLAAVDLDGVQRTAAGVGDEAKGDGSTGELVGDRDRERRARRVEAIAPAPEQSACSPAARNVQSPS